MEARELSFHRLEDDIKKILKDHPSLAKKKVTVEVLDAIAEYLDLFTQELGMRAAFVARSDRSSFVESEHIEKILAQLLLDFS